MVFLITIGFWMNLVDRVDTVLARPDPMVILGYRCSPNEVYTVVFRSAANWSAGGFKAYEVAPVPFDSLGFAQNLSVSVDPVSLYKSFWLSDRGQIVYVVMLKPTREHFFIAFQTRGNDTVRVEARPLRSIGGIASLPRRGSADTVSIPLSQRCLFFALSPRQNQTAFAVDLVGRNGTIFSTQTREGEVQRLLTESRDPSAQAIVSSTERVDEIWVGAIPMER